MINQLLAAGADVEAGEDGKLPLEIAVRNVDEAMPDRLIESIEELKDSDSKGVEHALAILTLVLDHGADPSHSTALHLAASLGFSRDKQLRLKVFNILLEAGADVNKTVPDDSGAYCSPGNTHQYRSLMTINVLLK